MSSHHRHESNTSDGSYSGGNHQHHRAPTGTLEQPILVYHDSARSIVFRDHLRRAVNHHNKDDDGSTTRDITSAPHQPLPHQKQTTFDAVDASSSGVDAAVMNLLLPGGLPSSPKTPRNVIDHETTVGGFVPNILPLPNLELGPMDDFTPLLASTCAVDNSTDDTFTDAEREVCRLLHTQQCVVKTIKNVDWGDFLQRFTRPLIHSSSRQPKQHGDISPTTAADINDPMATFPFNSFVTSTTLLPCDGKRMRCYGTTNQYTTGVVFALPSQYRASNADDGTGGDDEDDAILRTETWSWPAGYSAKTEFNIDSRGRLINGRQEALVSLSVLRQYNDDYVNKDEYMIGNRLVQGLQTIPYNEVFLRVGGLGRIVNDRDSITGLHQVRSFDRGCGLPVALFVRSATFGHLISLLRTRSRLAIALGEAHVKGIPLLLIDPDLGVRVLTESLQRTLWKIASSNLTPFQNSTISFKTTLQHTDEKSFQQKVDELITLDDTIRDTLTPEELARLAGGFGATDDSVATVLQQVMMEDKKLDRLNQQSEQAGDEKSHMLQDVVNEGLAAAVRSGDYHTSRQLLMLYSFVASQGSGLTDDGGEDEKNNVMQIVESNVDQKVKQKPPLIAKQTSLGRNMELTRMDLDLMQKAKQGTLSTCLPAPPPPPPLDTDRLRSATNSDGLLAVLGAAQVLKAMQDGSAKQRSLEVVSAVEEWVNHGEQSMAFRIASYFDQRAAQGDLRIATETNSQFLAFVSNKAISNRKMFAQQIREAVGNTDFNDVRFLLAIDQILTRMNSPCLRLELLQYVLGLDNRYSVAHVSRSVELAASCLSIASLPTS